MKRKFCKINWEKSEAVYEILEEKENEYFIRCIKIPVNGIYCLWVPKDEVILQ
jgi:hypothetical protein